MNLKIKFRESFRPFAPSVLQERAAGFFEMAPGVESPYMLLVADVQAAQRAGSEERNGLRGLDLLKQKRSTVQAITHVDYSARVQTVDAVRNPAFHRLLTHFERKTGCPVIINTSFNVRGEPIVATPEDAFRCFMNTDMDALVLENYVLIKSEQPAGLAQDREQYLGSFALD
jgi:carbamoyltransferase